MEIRGGTFEDYTQYTASGTGLVGRYQNFERLDGTVDIKFPK